MITPRKPLALLPRPSALRTAVSAAGATAAAASVMGNRAFLRTLAARRIQVSLLRNAGARLR